MEASSGDRKPTSWTARVLAPVLLVVVAAAIVLIVSGTLSSDDDGGADGRERQASTGGGGCSPPEEIEDAVKDGYYVVQDGDNFTTIAERTCISEDRLQQLNPNLDPFGLQVQNCVDLVTDGCKSLSGG